MSSDAIALNFLKKSDSTDSVPCGFWRDKIFKVICNQFKFLVFGNIT